MQVLIISSDANYSNFLKRKLSTGTMQFTAEQSLNGGLERLKRGQFDGIICCLPLLTKNCPFEVVKMIKDVSTSAKIILICDQLPLHRAMELMRQGVYSGFIRPFPLEELTRVLEKLATECTVPQVTQKAEEVRKEKKRTTSLDRYVSGVSTAARQMYQKIDLVGPTNFSVIIYGETGTGKESVAERLSQTGNKPGPYIAVDCGCLSKELALSELFGHEKGSFTGAVSNKVGAFELANNGTLFLDEIGNLDHEVQGFLLRAIQERKIRRVGSVKEIDIDTRIIVASNENLAEAVRKGKFREDLFHRLNEFEIVVAPLRDRREDLPLFLQRFIEETNEELGKNVSAPDAEAMDKLSGYNWPGNIRELRNVVRRACLMCPDGQAISVRCLPDEIVHYNENEISQAITSIPPGPRNVYVKAREITLNKLTEVLEMVNYNKSKAAAILGIDRKTIYNKLKSAC